jgi:alkylated DNA repair dioxygenase AlkB
MHKRGSSTLPEQFALFADEQPRGLRYAADFISPATEIELIERIGQLAMAPFRFGQYEGKRRVASFGYSYDDRLRRLKRAASIPDWLEPLVRKVEAFGGPDTLVRQVLFTEYQPGVGIGWHHDKKDFDRIFGLSLGSSCKFRFRRSSGANWDRYTLDAAPRSLYEMSGEARNVWEHSIPGVEAARYSITFRTMAGQCELGEE